MKTQKKNILGGGGGGVRVDVNEIKVFVKIQKKHFFGWVEGSGSGWGSEWM